MLSIFSRDLIGPRFVRYFSSFLFSRIFFSFHSFYTLLVVFYFNPDACWLWLVCLQHTRCCSSDEGIHTVPTVGRLQKEFVLDSRTTNNFKTCQKSIQLIMKFPFSGCLFITCSAIVINLKTYGSSNGNGLNVTYGQHGMFQDK